MFEPREAANPRQFGDDDQTVKWEPFTDSVENCLKNLQYAFEYKQNVINYERILASQFKFYFDTQDVIDFTVPVYWSKAEEIDMLVNFHQSMSGVELSFEVIASQKDSERANNAWVYRLYSIKQGETVVHEGRFQLYLEKDASGWKIKEWYDFRYQGDRTWGRLKNEFS
jgi:hypothetical protein